MPGERPYVKYDSSGGDTIHVAYTNAHPTEFGDVNIYYARVRGGRIERAGGAQIGSLDDPIAPAEGDLVYDRREQAWVHDVAADGSGRPVIVFASFPSATDHRYRYARWTGSSWDVHQITPAGGSFREDGGSPYYSGGLTLDHEDPSRVYLSRQIGPGTWQVETWTTPDGGASWSSQVVASSGKNVRPVSPRGMSAAGGEMSVVWMNGGYPSYVAYDTAIEALMPSATNVPPVADAEPAVRSGRAPLEVTFDDDGLARPRRLDRGLRVGLRRRHDRRGSRADPHLHGRRALLPDAHGHGRRAAHRPSSSRRSSSTCPPRPSSTPAAPRARPCTAP